MTKEKKHIIKFEDVRDRIVEVRGQRAILDFAVAELYGVETREINQAVRNNPEKFPKGYVFELDNQESAVLRSKLLILKPTSGSGKGSKYNFKAFTERGIYMLATPQNQKPVTPLQGETEGSEQEIIYRDRQ